MSYHMSGSMGRSSGYGTIKIFLQNTDGLTQGQEYPYTVQGQSQDHTATADRIEGRMVLVDSNYTIGENPPPFSAGMALTVFIPQVNVPLLTTIITDIKPFGQQESNPLPIEGGLVEEEPTSPPDGFAPPMNLMVGALSPLGQWTWGGPATGWNNIPGPPAVPVLVTTTLYDGANIRTFYLPDEMPIQEFLSTILDGVPVEGIEELDSNNEVVDTYDPTQPETQATTVVPKSPNRKKKKKKKFKLKKEKGKRVVPNNTRSITNGNTGRSIQPPGNRQSPGNGGRSATTQRPGGNSGTY